MQNVYLLIKTDSNSVLKINNVIIQTLTNNDIIKFLQKSAQYLCGQLRLEHSNY